MNRITLPFLLFILTISSLQAQRPSREALNDQLAVASSDSLRAAVFNQLARTYVRVDYDSAYLLFNNAVKLARQSSAQLLAVNSLCFQSMNHAMVGQLDSAKTSLLRALEISREHEMDSATSQVYFGLGNIVESAGDLTGALDYYLKALTFFEATGQEKSINRTKANISYIYMKTGDLELAQQLIEESNAYYASIGDPRRMMNGFSRLSSLYHKKGMLDSAVFYMRRSVEIVDELDDSFTKVEHQITLADLLMEQAKYREAEPLYRTSIDYLEQNASNAGLLLNAYGSLMVCEARLGKNVNDVRYVNRIVEIIPQVQKPIHLIDYYRKQFVIDSLRGRGMQAVASLQQHYALRDSIASVEKSRQLGELQTKYETEKKDKEILSLTQQASISALQLQQQRMWIAGLVIVMFLATGLGVLFLRQEKYKKEKQVTDLMQRNLRSQMNPHFIFNSMAAIQYYMQEKGSEQAGHYMGMFSTLMRQMLDHSRQEFISLGEEVSALTNYLELQKIRFDGQFDYEIEVDESLDETYSGVPPMFAQPFVENALEHGLFKSNRENRITVKFETENDELIGITVHDTGTGLMEPTSTNDHQSLATTITRERLQMFQKSLKQKTDLLIKNLTDTKGEVIGLSIHLTLPTKVMMG